MTTGATSADRRPASRSTATGTRLAVERRARTRPADQGPADESAQRVPPRPVPELPIAEAPVLPEVDAVDAVLEIEEGGTTLFEAAIDAYHAGEYTRAESLFLEEASRALDAAPQRAAIAYRQAALAAREAGNLDGSDHWMRLAGREYLRVSEDVRTPLPFIRESAVMAAKCFLSVENLHVANKGLRRAQAIESVLRADDDLSSAAPDIPFHHETVAISRGDSTAVVVPGPRSGEAEHDGGPDRRGLGRLRHLLPRRPAA